MRTARVLGSESRPSNYYHVTSRILGELPFWADADKEALRELLHRLLAFSGLRMVTFCLMGNHLHLLLEVPTDRESLRSLSDEEFLQRLEILYSDEVVQRVHDQLSAWRESGSVDQAEALRERFLARMHDLPAFMRELKQRFTQYYNATYQRSGTIWRDRYQSALVEDSEEALRTMAAYIDLNPVRAKLVADPKDYRWSGYGEAMAGRPSAREGLTRLIQGEVATEPDNAASKPSWKEIQAIYRCWLYADGRERWDESGQFVTKAGFDADTVEKVLAKKGALAYPILASTRLRHFSQGVAIGSKQFTEEIFVLRREFFSQRRVDGARKIPKLPGLMAMRELRG